MNVPFKATTVSADELKDFMRAGIASAIVKEDKNQLKLGKTIQAEIQQIEGQIRFPADQKADKPKGNDGQQLDQAGNF